jgi:nucleoside-diphosphate-sugar epimerase
MDVISKKVLVTGGSGFIGSRLVAALLEVGHTVTIYDKRKTEIFPEISISADVKDKVALASVCRGMEVVYHLAAEHADDVRPARLYYDVNVKGAEHVVSAGLSQEFIRLFSLGDKYFEVV